MPEDLEHPEDPGRAAGGEPVARGPADEDGACTQGKRLHDVAAAAHAAVHRHLGVAADLVDDLGELVERRRNAVELPAAVVRHFARIDHLTRVDEQLEDVRRDLSIPARRA